MRHDVERYRMLLQAEKNPRIRKLLLDMIRELESRVALIRPRVRAAKDKAGTIRTGILA